MSAFHQQAFDLGELSRRKLRKVAESSDTLRRAVLIHNIVRSTASLPPSPTDFNDNHDYAFPSTASASAPPPPPTEQEEAFIFPSMTSSSMEQDWLDSILDDLESDVHVSVADLDDSEDMELDDAEPLFPSCPPPSPPTSVPSPSAAVTAPASSFYPTPESPPASPPGLDIDTIDSDDDSDEEDFGRELTSQQSSLFLDHLPFHDYPLSARPRPAHFIPIR